MSTITHPEMVAGLAKRGQAIIDELTPNKAHVVHMAIGISGEAGELLDAIKKYVMYNKPLDRENAVEELGDLEFYLEGIRQGLGITREETITHNIKKLTKRYSEGSFSNNQANKRADKNE